MTKYHVYILTNQNIAHTSYIYGKKSLYVSVSEANPYDRLSKRFKRFTHTIEYPRGNYNLEDYFIEVYDPNRHFYKYLLKYNKPLHKLISVDFFFSVSDKSNNTPLVLGFHQENEATIYYTANFLYYYTSGLFAHQVKNHYLPSEYKFYDGDVLIRLLEELSLYFKDSRKDKLVIKSDLRPTNRSITYPQSGPNDKKVTVSKISDQKSLYFDKYTHLINKPSDDSGFYISYGHDSLYVELNDNKYKKLTYFNSYYNPFDYSTPIVFVLKFQKGNKLYRYADFANHLRESNLTIKVTDLNTYDDSKIYNEILKENNRVNNYVTYLIDKKTEYSHYIYVRENELFKNKYGFKNYTHRPYINYNDKKSHLVFNGKKMLKWKTIARLAELYDETSVTFESVDVYFGTRKPDFPLIVKITKKGQFSTNPDFFVHRRNISDEFWEQLYVRSGEITHEILLSKLNKADFDLIPSVVLLLDKKENYSYRDIVYGVGRAETPKDFILSEVDTKGIKAKDITGTLGTCINGKGFKVVEQDLSLCIKHNKERGLRFFVLSSSSGRYSEITLHSSDKEPFDAYEEYIYSDQSLKSVYVYFYSNNSMPLMICYGKSAYRPHSNEYYSEKWVKVTKLTNFLCSSPPVDAKSDELLLSTLTEIAASLGLIKLEEPSQFSQKTSSAKLQRPESTHEVSETTVTRIDEPRTETTKDVFPRPSVDTQHSITERPSEVPKITTVEINLSIKEQTTYGSLFNISVSSKMSYPDLDLFCYYTHTSTDKAGFKISSFKLSDFSSKTITVKEIIENVRSVTVYFNTYNNQNPVMIGITTSDNETKYYVNIIQDKQDYDFSTFRDISKQDLTQKLIEESDRVNEALTYHLEKSVTSGESLTYGHNGGIKITKIVKSSHNFTIHKHEPIKHQSAKNYVMFNGNVPFTKTRQVKTSITDVQHRTYKNIQIYYLNTDMEVPLIMEFNEARTKTTYVYRKDGTGYYWENKSADISTNYGDDDKIEALLVEINYPLKKSVIIELNKNIKTEYEMKLIDNTLKNISNKEYEKAYKDGKPLDTQKKITVNLPSKVIDSAWRTITDFKFLSHEIPTTAKPSDISGIRIFITKSSNTQLEEIELYQTESDASHSRNKLFLYYPTKNKLNKIYGYFHGIDSRPLLLCYDRQVYKQLHSDNTKWIFVNKVSCSESSEVIDILKSVHGTMKKKVTFVKSGKKQNVFESSEESFGIFKRVKYTADTRTADLKSSFTLQKSDIIQGMKDIESINKLLDGLNGKPFDSISIYFQNRRSSVFLYEFIDETVKTHFQKVEPNGKYWIEKRVDYKSDTDLPSVLSQLNNTIHATVVYEIDKTSSAYNDSIKVDTQMDFQEYGFTKYTHSPKDGTAKSSLILYRKNRLKKKGDDEIVIMSEIENVKYKNISVYYGNKAKDRSPSDENIPLVIELFNGSSGANYSIYYKHTKDSKNKFWERVTTITSVNRTADLLSTLRETEFDFLESIVILTDMNTRYGENEMNQAIANLNVSNELVIAGIDNESLTVTENESSTCLGESGFKYREHNLNRTKYDVWYGLRFFVKGAREVRYRELTLYDKKSKRQDYLIHNREYNIDKVCVYFYGEDLRPLLISYGKVGFSPDSSEHYHSHWSKLNDDVNFDCYFNDSNGLVEALSKAVVLLNEVQLEQRPYPTDEKRPMRNGSETKTYDLQIFNGDTISVKVTYRNMNCCRVYKHEPNGTGSDGSGYRLGNILYNRKQGEGLNYEISKQLKAVNVYYYVYDYNHTYPLLVSLEYKGGDDKEYFELNDKREKKWKKINESFDDGKVEEKIKSLVKSLPVELNSDNGGQTLFDTKECYDDSGPSTTTIAAASGGTVTTAALVGGGVTAAIRPEWFVPVIRALV